MESGGKYHVKGPVTKSGDRAYGKYQIMGSNIPSWSKEILGKSITPLEFLRNPELQEQIARAKMQQYYDQTGTHADVVAKWHSGKPYAGNMRRDVNMSTKDYTHRIAQIYNKLVG